MKAHVIVLSAFMMTFTNMMSAGDAETTDTGKRLEASAQVLNRIMTSTAKSIPPEVLAEAKCIAVIPSLLKIALGVGSRHGKGVATCRTDSGWSAPGPISITGGSIGLQVGTQSVDVILVILDEQAFRDLLSKKFKIGTEVAGSPGPVGVDIAEADWRKAQILTYSQSHGAFAGVNLEGTVVKQDKDAIVELYGRYVPIVSILSGKLPPPAGSHQFLAAVRKYIREGQHG